MVFGTGKGAGKLVLIMILVVGVVFMIPKLKERFG